MARIRKKLVLTAGLLVLLFGNLLDPLAEFRICQARILVGGDTTYSNNSYFVKIRIDFLQMNHQRACALVAKV